MINCNCNCGGIRTPDLAVKSPTPYHCATPHPMRSHLGHSDFAQFHSDFAHIDCDFEHFCLLNSGLLQCIHIQTHIAWCNIPMCCWPLSRSRNSEAMEHTSSAPNIFLLLSSHGRICILPTVLRSYLSGHCNGDQHKILCWSRRTLQQGSQKTKNPSSLESSDLSLELLVVN